jgi:hypothetical protein
MSQRDPQTRGARNKDAAEPSDLPAAEIELAFNRIAPVGNAKSICALFGQADGNDIQRTR